MYRTIRNTPRRLLRANTSTQLPLDRLQHYLICKILLNIKGRYVAVSSKQRSYDGYEKPNGSSPVVITNSIFLTDVIDANNNRAMSTVEVGNIFIQADNNKQILMLLHGKVAELMVRVNPTLYRPTSHI